MPGCALPEVAGAPRIALFEASGRIGGRLWSFVPPGMPHLRAELGGMRIPTDQTLVVFLVDHLGIETIPFPMGDDNNLRYLRGRRDTVADLDNPNIVPYDLPPPYRGKTPDEITIETIERYIPHASRLSAREWNDLRRTATFEGVPLYDLGFRHLMQRELPDEAYQFIRDDATPDDFNLSTSAVDLMYEFAAGFLVTSPIVTPLLGMQEIPRSLPGAAECDGASIYRQHRVHRITALPHANAETPPLELEVESTADGGITRFAARHVVLAMPPRAIVLLAPDSLPLTAP